MAPTDPHQGGNLFDMAAEGTTMPNDAGKMNIIPSKPGPRDTQDGDDGPGNATDISRTVRDSGLGGGEILTGTGYVFPPILIPLLTNTYIGVFNQKQIEVLIDCT